MGSTPTDLASQIVACGSVATDGSRVAGAGKFASARTGAGVYTVTLQEGGVDSTQCVVNLSLRTASGILRCTHTSDTVKTIEAFAVDGTTATDKAFDFEIKYLPPGQ